MNKRIFISYARDDKTVAEKVHLALSERKFETWIDFVDLRPGQDWKREIKAAIKSCRLFVALLSSRSLGKKGIVQKEIRVALDVLDEFPPGEVYIVPARIDDCEPRHDQLKNIQWIDLFPAFEDGLAKLTKCLEFELQVRPECIELSERYGSTYETLSALMNQNQLNAGFRALEHLHETFKNLLAGKHQLPLWDIYDHGYATWHVYFFGPSLRAIADEGWVAKHAKDIALLAQSKKLSAPERRTVANLFGREEFHIAVAATPVSDDLIKQIHHCGESSEMLMRIVGRECDYHCCYGSYPPPVHSSSPDNKTRCIAVHYAAFNALPVND